MAGHSKWANIKHKKGREDAKRGKIFTKIIKELTVAAKGGANIADNPRLRLVVDKAYAANMTKDTIERAIARGAGTNEADNMVEIVYEGYAPNGVAVIVEVMTDNKNRAAAEVRHAFSKSGGNLGTDGSVSYMFNRVGQMQFIDVDLETLMNEALEAGASDIIEEEDFAIVQTEFSDFHNVLNALNEKGLKPKESDITMIANVEAPIIDLETAQKVMKLIDALEDLDDVQNVYHNADIPMEILEQL